MANKIIDFLNNKIVKTVEFVLIVLCCVGLGLAGVKAEEIAKIPALVFAILGGISALAVYITSIVKK